MDESDKFEPDTPFNFIVIISDNRRNSRVHFVFHFVCWPTANMPCRLCQIISILRTRLESNAKINKWFELFKGRISSPMGGEFMQQVTRESNYFCYTFFHTSVCLSLQAFCCKDTPEETPIHFALKNEFYKFGKYCVFQIL